MSRPKGSKNLTAQPGRHQGVKKKSRYEPRTTLEEAATMFNEAYDNVFCAKRPWLAYRPDAFLA